MARLISALLLISAGCFSLKEEFTVKPDGTGTVKATFTTPKDNEKFVTNMVDSLVNEGWEKGKRVVKGDTLVFSASTEADFGAGEYDRVTLTTEGNTTTFDYVVPGTKQEGADVGMAGYNYELVVKLPSKPLSHNADEVSGNKLTWKMPMGDYVSKGVSANATYKGAAAGGGFPWGLVFGVFCCLVLVAAVVVVILLLVKKKKG